MWRVLVVDDEPSILALIRGLLESSGFAVLTARNGAEALPILETQRVDALLTDLVMPGMSGAQLTLAAWRRQPGLPVCCMSGYAPEPDSALEGTRFLAKPFGFRQLLDMVRQLVNESDASSDRLHRQMLEARRQWIDAMSEVDSIVAQAPSGIPETDGFLRLQKARQERARAFGMYKQALALYKQSLAGSSGAGKSA